MSVSVWDKTITFLLYLFICVESSIISAWQRQLIG